jgi:hypothetical protein
MERRTDGQWDVMKQSREADAAGSMGLVSSTVIARSR